MADDAKPDPRFEAIARALHDVPDPDETTWPAATQALVELDTELRAARASGPVYVASSWRNEHQPEVVSTLRDAGIDCYDFRNPAEGEHGFGWRQCEGVVGPSYRHGDKLRSDGLIRLLDHPVAQKGFASDWNAMRAARACVLVMPCGRSAHIEAGYFVGARRPLHILLTGPAEPELMWRMAIESGGGIHTSIESVVRALGGDRG